MDSVIWDECRKLSSGIKSLFDRDLTSFTNKKLTREFEGWTDLFWSSDTVRKAHLKIIEPTPNNPKLWLMHVNVFPHENVNIPILGFDVVAGPNKISGSFFDFSPVSTTSHPYNLFFEGLTSNLSWKKERELPEWAKEIFSPHIVAAGNIQEEAELKQFVHIGLAGVEFYLRGINELFYKTDESHLDMHNKYCKNQKMNVQLHKSILSMGISEEDKDDYINNVLFEEL